MAYIIQTLLYQLLPSLLVCYALWILFWIIKTYMVWIASYKSVTSIGPWHPIYGHMHIIHDSESLLKVYSDVLEKTRGKIFGGWVFCFPWFAVTHPDTVKVLLKSSEPKPIGVGGSYYPVKDWLGDGLLISHGRKWLRNRRLLTPAFHFNILAPYVKIYNNVVDIFLNKLWTAGKSGDSVEIYESTCLATLDTMLRCAFSYEGDIQSEGSKHPYAYASKRLSHIAVQRSLQPWNWIDFIFYNLTSDGKEFRKYADYVHGFSDAVIKTRKKSLEEDPSQLNKRKLDFLDILLTAKDESGLGLSDLDIRNEVDTFMFAGHDTTASTISWALYALAKYPDQQTKVAEDVRRVLGKSTQVTWEDLSKFSYLNLFIREVMRMYSPVPFISRKLTRPMSFEGTELPVNVTIDINVVSVHHNPDVYPDHEVFRPDRFDEKNSEGRDPYAFIPFSAGPRNCIGQNFAMNEIKVFIARIVQRYNVTLDENHAVGYNPDFVMRPKNGIKIKVSLRDT